MARLSDKSIFFILLCAAAAAITLAIMTWTGSPGRLAPMKYPLSYYVSERMLPKDIPSDDKPLYIAQGDILEHHKSLRLHSDGLHPVNLGHRALNLVFRLPGLPDSAKALAAIIHHRVAAWRKKGDIVSGITLDPALDTSSDFMQFSAMTRKLKQDLGSDHLEISLMADYDWLEPEQQAAFQTIQISISDFIFYLQNADLKSQDTRDTLEQLDNFQHPFLVAILKKDHSSALMTELLKAPYFDGIIHLPNDF